MTNVHNTLYVTADGAYVAKEGESLKVRVNHETRLQIPMHHLVSLVCFGTVGVSPEAMAACAEQGIVVVFLGYNGRFLARVEGKTSNTVTLRRAQMYASDNPVRALEIARGFVAGKIANSRVLLRRGGRTRGSPDAMNRAGNRLLVLGERILTAPDLDVLRGIEGEAASRYFEVFNDLLESDEFVFGGRSRRPPLDAVNALLSFGYALLGVDCTAAAQAAGLDPALGFLHAERPGRPSLAMDLMEEFRSPFVDRLVLGLIRLGQVKVDDFESLPTGEVRMRDTTRKLYLVEYQKRKQEEVTHPLTGQKAAWAVMPHIQARLLARALRGEGDYVPMVLK